MRELPADIARQLLDQARLSPSEVEDRLQKAHDAAYWRQLAPDLPVEGAPVDRAEQPMSQDAITEAARAVADDGVFHLRGVLPAETLARLNVAIDSVIAAGWPPVFAFAYDEPWQCARTPAVLQVLREAFDGEPGQCPKVWIHFVRPAADAAGWPPHLDGFGGRRINCWFALTAATVDNGCIHVVPRRLAVPDLSRRLDAHDTFATPELVSMLHGVTPMPASAGDVLGWSFDVIHWGGQTRRGRSERRSMALEFIADGEPLLDHEQPLLPLTGPLPPLAVRCRSIGFGVLRYVRFEPLLRRFEDVARRMV